jgi:phage/plasmid primase-like uncharacterized protein
MFSDTSALCMRVNSNRPFLMKNGDMGWWHDNGTQPSRALKSNPIKEPPLIDAVGIMLNWVKSTRQDWIERMASEIGVTCEAVSAMGVAWSALFKAWAWPMRDGNGKVCGIRLRANDGKKWAVKGSQQGLFEPIMTARNRVFLPEGPTDTAALVSLGVFAIGRPSASGGLMAIKQAVTRLRIREVVIIADNDEDKEHNGRKFNPGYDGATSLQNHLMVPSCIISLPTKDAREFLKAGGDKEMLDNLVDQAVWHRPT